MAFFDKLGNIAKNVGDKASDAVETTKLNSKISKEKAAIAEDMRRIGEICYGKHATGGETDPDFADALASIDAHNAAIAEAEAQIAALKEDDAQPAAPAQQPQYTQPQYTQPQYAQPQYTAAPAQTAQAAPAQGEYNAAPAAAARFCPNCGAPVQAGVKFCSGCGNKLE